MASTEIGTHRDRAGGTEDFDYRPSKKKRDIRRRAFTRYEAMATNEFRKEAETEWDKGDKLFRMWTGPRDPDDWRADLILPDTFAAVQATMQETIDRKSRPRLVRVEDSDMAKEEFANAVLNFSMDRTDFDFQYFQAKYSAAIRGIAFLVERYRIDKRTIFDPTGVNDDGTLKYTKKEVTDFDDAFTEHVANEYIFTDERALHVDNMIDMVEREILDHDEFKRVYGLKPDFIDIDKVKNGGDTGQKGFFKLPEDMEKNEVEVLHYYNRATDEYNVLANNVVIRIGPIPFKHKELPIAAIYHYYVPGRFYGIGIPKVIESLTEERSTLRNLNLDRQKMQLNKMVFVNDAIDLDEEEMVTRPFGVVNVPSGGMPLNQAIMPFEYGQVGTDYYKTEETIIEDIRRAHGIDDRVQGVNMGGTATEAAILKESASRRINMIAQLVEIDTMRRIGKLKWSNIQFFYKAPKIEKIVRENKEVEKKTFKKVSVKGRQFEITQNDHGVKELQMNDFDGTSSFELNKSFATFMEGDIDVTVSSEAYITLSKPLQQAKITEMVDRITGNPAFAAEIEPRKALQRYLEVNDEKVRSWMKDARMTDEDFMALADRENYIMSTGVPLDPTPDANQAHTLVHLNFTNTREFEELTPEIKDMMRYHILGEHEKNPQTGSVAEAAGMAGSDEAAGGPPRAAPGAGGPEMQPVDMQPTPPAEGEAPPNTGENQDISLS